MKAVMIAALALVISTSAQAAQRCAPTQSYAVFLMQKHGEQVIDEQPGQMRDGRKSLWHLWANPETKAWSLTATFEQSGILVTCMATHGDDYHGVSISGLLNPTDKSAEENI